MNTHVTTTMMDLPEDDLHALAGNAPLESLMAEPCTCTPWGGIDVD